MAKNSNIQLFLKCGDALQNVCRSTYMGVLSHEAPCNSTDAIRQRRQKRKVQSSFILSWGSGDNVVNNSFNYVIDKRKENKNDSFSIEHLNNHHSIEISNCNGIEMNGGLTLHDAVITNIPASISYSLPLWTSGAAAYSFKNLFRKKFSDKSFKSYSFCYSTISSDSPNVIQSGSVQNDSKVSQPKPNDIKMEFYRRQLPETCISFCSEEGKLIFSEALSSGHMDSYCRLASQFMTQDEPAYCGLSTLVMVLNALEIDPNRVWKAPWRWYDERMLDCCVPLSIVKKNGITMDQLACLAACNSLQVNLHRADSDNNNLTSAAQFRETVILATQRTDIVVVAAYSRKALRQTGDGHFACIGGYNPSKDLVLIMDTARFKYPPHWVPLNLLYAAMQAADSNTGLPRGYLVLSRSQMPKALLFHLTSDVSPMSLSPSDSANAKTSLEYLVKFADSWEAWLGSMPTNGESEVMSEAVREMVRLLKGRKLPLCTSMMRGNRTPEEWRRHQKDVIQLIASLEELQLYRTTRESCVESLYECDDVSGTSIKVNAAECEIVNCCKHSGESGDGSFMDDDFLSKLNKETQSIAVPLSRAHFAAMLLLSWPYHRCTSSRSRRSRGHILMDEVKTLMKSKPSNILLERETTRLRQQLSSILIYLRSSGAECNK